MRQDYKVGKVVPFLLDLPINFADGTQKRGYFCVYIKSSPDKKKIYKAFRGDIMIFKEKCSSSHPYDVVLVDVFNDDEGNELSEYMKYSEDPGHGEWKYSPASKSERKYKHGESWQKRFVQRAASALLNVLTGTVEKEKLTEFAEDIFFIEREVPSDESDLENLQKSKNSKAGNSSPKIPDEIPPKKPEAFAIEKMISGFKVKGTKYLGKIYRDEKIYSGKLRAAFVMPGTGKSKWFNSFIPADFSFGQSVKIECTGADWEVTSENELTFNATSPDFEITFNGFDQNRDLYIALQETWRTENGE